MTDHLFSIFGKTRIINLVDRADRRSEMMQQFASIGGIEPPIKFFEAQRPKTAGEFPSVGARGCFESHLSILKSAKDSQTDSILILEDDFQFTRKGLSRAKDLLPRLAEQNWDFFYGAHLLSEKGRQGLCVVPPGEPVMTTSFVAVRGSVLPHFVDFLEGLLTRPGGSPDYGPMHVDGAYTVFRQIYSNYHTIAAFPTFGRQRSSPSDVTPGKTMLDRNRRTRPLAQFLRKSYNWLARF